MPKPDTPERRRAPRVAAELPLSFAGHDSAPAVLKDISTNGLCCTTAYPIEEMTAVRVRLDFENEPHELEGAVVRCVPAAPEGWHIAVFFTAMPDRARRQLDQFVEAHVEKGAPLR